jgi:phage terminase large subunit GpA-like protein
MREILDAACDPTIEELWLQMASQVGKSELALNVIGYHAHQDPAPILYVRETQDAAKSFSKERIDPTFRQTPALRGLLTDSQRDKGNTIELKMFPGGYLAFGSANAAATLASRSIRVLILDEIDKYPVKTGRDGDPIAQAMKRTANFYNRKIIGVSTPTIAGLSPIGERFAETDQRRRWVPCPHCGALQVLEWDGIVYKNALGEIDFDDVHYLCKHCGERIEERDKNAMDLAGEWKAEHPERRKRGYQMSCILSPWVRWADLAEKWVKINRDRDKRGLQEFINLDLGRVWATEDSEHVEAGDLDKNRSEYSASMAPNAVQVVTCGVDVQDHWIAAEWVGWGQGRESWGLGYRVLTGDTSQPQIWQELDELLWQTVRRADGQELIARLICIDRGGHRTDTVDKYCKARIRRGVRPIFGVPGFGRPIIGKPKQYGRHRVVAYPVGVDSLKDLLFDRLAIRKPGPGYCHFPSDPKSGYDHPYYLGLTSEKREIKTVAGRRRRRWVQIRERNEPLDVRNYATAALEILAPVLDLDQKGKAKQPSGSRRIRKRGKIQMGP